MPTRYYFLKIFWCKTECWCNYNTSWYSFKISILWNFCNRNFFLRLLIHLLVSIPTIIKTVTVLSALGEGKAIIMEAFDLWLGLDSDVVPDDVGLRLQHQHQQHHHRHHHHHHRHHHHYHHHGCNVTCRAVPGEVEAIIMEINHRLIRRGARWENASQGWRRSVWTTSHFRCCAVDPNNTSPHSSHLPTLTILHAIIHTWETSPLQNSLPLLLPSAVASA